MCKLIAVTSRSLCSGDFLGQIRILAKAGVDQIVLREKDLDEREYEALAVKVLLICREYNTECVLHQNIAVARGLGETGIHLSLPAAQMYREDLKDFEVVGISTHSLEQVRKAEKCNASYVFFGHIFPTDCKRGVPARGLPALQEICHKSSVPVYAIGGISPKNALQAAEAGADGVCVMSWGMQESMEQIQSFVAACHKM